MRKRKILLYGYIGYQNFGDDLLFYIATKKLKKIENIDVYITVSQSVSTPEYLKKYYPSLKIILFNKRIPLLFFKKFDMVYFIGGGVFFDYKKEISNLSYYKNYISNFIRFKIPNVLGTHFVGAGIGIGPYFSNKTKKLHAQIIRIFDFLGVRDLASFELAKSMGKTDVFLTNDLSLELNVVLQKLNRNSKKRNEVIICPRTYSHKPKYEKHIDELIRFAEYLEKNNYKTHWIFLQKDKEELINKLNKFKITVWNPSEMSIWDFSELFSGALVTFTSRMHSIYISGMLKTPFVAITLHQKLIFASELFYKDPILIDPLAEQDVYLKSFERIREMDFDFEKLENEIHILSKLEEKLLTFLLII